ncbi:MAG TPA: helix-turn-helix transcriptional regulator [Thermoanaerobaculia bacterium]
MWNASVQEAQLFGRRLRELRKERGLTQEALAESADLSGNYISDLELGLKVPSLTILVRLSQALDVATTDLVADFTREAVKRMTLREHR